MADIRLTGGDDRYTQSAAERDRFDTVFGEAGNDTLRLYSGFALGGPGNDHIEHLVLPDFNGFMGAMYVTSGPGLRVNLAEGWAEDGLGGRDTLVGITRVAGSDAADALVIGNELDNFYWPSGGDDVFHGGGGRDGVAMNSWFRPAANKPPQPAVLDDLAIEVSADGRHAVITPKVGTGFRIEVRDVEYIEVTLDRDSGVWTHLPLSDFITSRSLATVLNEGGAYRWNSDRPLGSPASLSYSFVASSSESGFRPFSEAERQLVRDILAHTAGATRLDFTEVAETGTRAGQLRFGISAQSNTKGLATQPGVNGDAAGDVWMDVDSMLGLAPGSEGYQALLHEIGHALGLRHPTNSDAGDRYAEVFRVSDDRSALTVMSTTPPGDGLFRADWGPIDWLALRMLYGTRAVQESNDTYALDPDDGAAMRTLVDDGGTDTLDASRILVGVKLDLNDGQTGSTGATPSGQAALENLSIAPGTLIENAIGSRGDDVLLGNDLDNRLTGGPGNDIIDGGAGLDTALLELRRADYELRRVGDTLYLEARDGRNGLDTLTTVERLHFADGGLALDFGGRAGMVAQILRAMFGPEAVSNPAFAGIGLRLADTGASYADLVALALGTAEFWALAGGRSNSAFVKLVYSNVVGQPPGAADLATFAGLLESGAHTQQSLALLASQDLVNTASPQLVGLAAIGLPFDIGGL